MLGFGLWRYAQLQQERSTEHTAAAPSPPPRPLDEKPAPLREPLLSAGITPPRPPLLPACVTKSPPASFQERVIGLEVVELQGGGSVINAGAPSPELLELGFDVIQLPHLLAGIVRAIPASRLGRELLEILLPCCQCRDVKDSPGLGPGGQ